VYEKVKIINYPHYIEKQFPEDGSRAKSWPGLVRYMKIFATDDDIKGKAIPVTGC
jgi:hypothetical protein